MYWFVLPSVADKKFVRRSTLNKDSIATLL